MSPFATATQTAPSATAMPWGLKPSRMVFTTWFVRGSMREIVPAAWFVTQIAPAPAASASGSSPVGMIASTLPVAASIRQTAFLPRQGTQADPKPTATSVGWLPTAMRLIRLVPASIRHTVPSPTFATQAAPAPNATCPGNTPLGELNLFWILPFRMLTREIAAGSDEQSRSPRELEPLVDRERRWIDVHELALREAADEESAAAGGDKPGRLREPEPADQVRAAGAGAHSRECLVLAVDDPDGSVSGYDLFR